MSAEQQNVEGAGDATEVAPQDAATKQALAGLGGLMQNPQILAALQNQLGSMVGQQSGYVKTLPKAVQRRIKALKKLQGGLIDVEAKFYEEVHELEVKYASQYAPLYAKRREVVAGDVEPTDSDCEWPSDEEDEEEQVAAKVEEVTLNGDGEEEEEEKAPAGVPEFWLTIFKNVDMLQEMVQEHDQSILSKLTDITVAFDGDGKMGFTLSFHFAENDFFSNTVLTKHYEMRAAPDQEDVLGFEGPEIVKCSGCTIDWKKGKNVTVKLVKKTQKSQRGARRTITKSVQQDSFFNFFSPPEHVEGEELDEETEELLGADYEIGHFLRERIVPRAVLYFTGEALEDEDDYGEDDEEEGDDEDGDEAEYDEDEDADYVIPK